MYGIIKNEYLYIKQTHKPFRLLMISTHCIWCKTWVKPDVGTSITMSRHSDAVSSRDRLDLIQSLVQTNSVGNGFIEHFNKTEVLNK